MKILPFLILSFCHASVLAQFTSDTVVAAGYDQSEPTVAVSPLNPNLVMAVWNDRRPLNQYVKPGYAFSTDGGSTWNNTTLPDHDGYRHGFDPSCGFDRRGNAFYGYVAADSPNVKEGPVYVSRISDFTYPFEGWVHEKVSANDEDQDKPFIAIDNTGKQFDGRVYIGWVNNYCGTPGKSKNQILFAYSIDSGATFTQVSPFETKGDCDGGGGGVMDGAPIVVCGDPPPHVNNPITAIGPSGEVYVSWIDVDLGGLNKDTIKFKKSTDGGQSFGATGFVAAFTYLYDQLGNEYSQCFGFDIRSFQSTAVSPNGNIFVVYPDTSTQGTPSIRIKFVRSTNGGSSWSVPAVIGNLGTGRQVFPSIFVEQNERINVSFVHVVSDTAIQPYVTTSLDDGATFTTPMAIGANTNPYFSYLRHHYNGITASNRLVHPIWSSYASTTKANIFTTKLQGGPVGASPVSTAYGNSPKTLLSNITNKWHSLYIRNNDLRYVFSADDGFMWQGYNKLSGTLGGINSNSSPAMVEDANGTLHVIFCSAGNGLYYLSKKSSGSWFNTPRQLVAGSNLRYPALRIDASGTGHVAFITAN